MIDKQHWIGGYAENLRKHASSPTGLQGHAKHKKHNFPLTNHISLLGFLILNDCCRKWLGYLQCIQLWLSVQKMEMNLYKWLSGEKNTNKKTISRWNRQMLGRPFSKFCFTPRRHAFTTFRNPCTCLLHIANYIRYHTFNSISYSF